MRRISITFFALLAATSAWAEDGLMARTALSGDWGGGRTALENAGLFPGADEIDDLLDVASGGTKPGAAFQGRLELFLNADLDAALGWHGAIFHANAYVIHGMGPAGNLNNLLTAGNIEAAPATRLFGLWLQQSLDDDRLSLRLGQIAADDEFFASQYGALFLNSAFGWPAILGINLPSGGPAYPLATPGARVRYALTPALVISAAAFNGDPAPAGPGSPQRRNASGTDFRLDGGLFLIGEAAYSFTAGADALPGTVKAGLWYHDGLFDDERRDAQGQSLADPAGSGVPARHRGDYGLYALADQLLWRRSGTSDQGLGAFLRIGGAPPGRNLIEFHADAGFNYTVRDSDMAGLGLSYERVSSAQHGLSRDLSGFSGLDLPPADYETALELSYRAQLAGWWIVQPDVQIILHPGARLANLAAPAQTGREGDAVMVGLRSAVNL